MTCHHHVASASRKRTRQTCRRICFVIIWGVAASYSVFRLVEMVLSDSLLSKPTPSDIKKPLASALGSKPELKAGPLTFPSFTVCNINPARGSALVKLPTARYNVSNVYENFVDFIKHRSTIKSGHVPLKMIYENAGHMIKDMLKSCEFNGKKACHFYDFAKSVTLGGLCFTLQPRQHNTSSVRFLLDPQGYDYILPNEGFVGVVLVVHSQYEPLVIKMDQSLQIGPKFYTTIHVTAKRVAFPGPRCTTEIAWKTCLDDCFSSQMLSRCKCSLTSLPPCTLYNLAKCSVEIDMDIGSSWLSSCNCQQPCVKTEYKIQSVVQTPRSPLLSRLQTIKERESLSRRVEVVKEANLVQQWAFLREANQTAFHTVEKMAVQLKDLYGKYSEIVHGLREFSLVWATRYVKNRHYTRNCMEIVQKIANLLGALRAKTMNVKDFASTIFFETPYSFPHNDYDFRVVHTFYKYSPDKIVKELNEFELSNFYQDLSGFDIEFQSFVQQKCDKTFANDGHKYLKEHESKVKIQMSEMKSIYNGFTGMFRDIYDHNKPIRQAYPTSMSKIKQIASPKTPSSFVTVALKFQRDFSIEIVPEKVTLVQSSGSDRAVLLVTSVLSISLFCTLLVYWFSKSFCKSRIRIQKKVKNVRPRPRPLDPTEEEEALACPTLLLQQQQHQQHSVNAAMQQQQHSTNSLPNCGGTLQRNKQQFRTTGELDCALTSISNNDYDDGWM